MGRFTGRILSEPAARRLTKMEPRQGFLTIRELLMRISGLSGIAIAAALLSIARPASAELISFNGTGRHLSNISISVGSQTASVSAGELNWTWLNGDLAGESLVSYCVDASTYLQGQQWVDLEDTSTLGSSQAGARVAYLFNTFAATVTSNLQAAALQLAIWEALYDSGQDLAGGIFKLNTINSALHAQTNAYLAQMYASNLNDSAITTWLNTGKGQDQVTRRVPEPSTLLLMAGAALFAARRKFAQR